MLRISEKILFGFILSIILSVSFSGVGLPANAQSGYIEINVSARGAYLYVDPQQNYGVESPGIADLQSNGISPDDTILISFEGTLDRYGGSNYQTIDYLIGVFSSTNQLLSVSESHRVPDAINAGDDFTTSTTWFSQENTDIPEDFQITPSTGYSIKVPQNAKYLFISMHDSWYPDNTSPGPIAVTIEKQDSDSTSGGFPLEYLLAALGIIAVIAILIVFFVFKRRKKKTQE